MDKYEKFSLLNDNVQNIDKYEEQIHEKIADAIYKLINNPKNEGITVGLEGDWGTGKSTIISILESKLKTKEKLKHKFHYFYFDAWAHEGNPLRRVFLEQLIIQCDTKNELSELNDVISKRKRIVNIKSSSTVTSLGKYLSISAFLVPFGTAILSNYDFSQVTFHYTGKILWLLILAIIASIAPLIVILGNLLKSGLPNKDNKKKWAFLEGDSDKEITNEVLEDEERSSIEFEVFFQQIIDKIIVGKADSLIIVIDNLDRIDSKDSLKIWSTLQTFLQQKNPIGKEVEVKYKQIWIIVPYDKYGLSKLWNDCSKSFFEKCFQLNFFVPKSIRTNWQSFVDVLIKESIPSWTTQDKKIMKEILINTRTSLVDVPTPREIKIYINQVIILSQYIDINISLSSICYFVIIKYINKADSQNHKIENLETNLLYGTIPEDNHFLFLDDNITMQLSGILFGTTPQLGQQMLLEPAIESALKGDINSLDKLIITHKEGFWDVLNYHILKVSNSRIFLEYANNIYNLLFFKYPNRIEYLLEKIKDIDIKYPEEQNYHDDTICLINLKLVRNSNANILWRFLIQQLNDAIIKEGKDIQLSAMWYISLIKCFEKYDIDTVCLQGFKLREWESFINVLNTENISVLYKIIPNENVLDELSKTITPEKTYSEKYINIFKYLIYSDLENWFNIFEQIIKYINYNSGSRTYSNINFELIKILCNVLLHTNDEKILEMGEKETLATPFYIFVNILYSKNRDIIIYLASIFALIYKEKLDSIICPNSAFAKNIYSDIKQTWNKENAETARKIWDLFYKNNKQEIFWEVAKNSKNKLVKSLFELAIETDINFFCNGDILKKCFLLKNFFKDAEIKDYLSIYLKNTNLLELIISADNIDISIEEEIIYYLLICKTNVEFEKYIKGKLYKISKETWVNSFENDTYLLRILLYLKEKYHNFYLQNSYHDALLEFIEELILQDISVKGFVLENWNNFLNILNNELREHLSNKITAIIWTNFNLLKIYDFKILLSLFMLEETIENHNLEVQNYIEDKIIKNDDISDDEYMVLSLILGKDKKRNLKFAKNFIEYIKAPLKEKIEKENNQMRNDVLSNLAKIIEKDYSD